MATFVGLTPIEETKEVSFKNKNKNNKKIIVEEPIIVDEKGKLTEEEIADLKEEDVIDVEAPEVIIENENNKED